MAAVAPAWASLAFAAGTVVLAVATLKTRGRAPAIALTAVAFAGAFLAGPAVWPFLAVALIGACVAVRGAGDH